MKRKIVKGMLLAFLGGLVVSTVMISGYIFVWFLINHEQSFTSTYIKFINMDLMRVDQVNGEFITKINNETCKLINLVTSILIFVGYTLLHYRKRNKSLENKFC